MKANKKRILKIALLSVLGIALTGGIVGYKMYTKPHRNVVNEKAVNISALELITAYETNEPAANTKYLDKVLAVTGEISEVSTNQKGEQVITLKGTDMGGLICTLEGPAAASIKPGATVDVKGICTGYLTDVVLVRSVVENKNN